MLYYSQPPGSDKAARLPPLFIFRELQRVIDVNYEWLPPAGAGGELRVLVTGVTGYNDQ